MDDFKIEPAIIDDVSQIALFQVDMAKESEDLDLDYNTVWSGVLAVFEDVEKGSYLVARSNDGELIASLLLTREWSDWRAKYYWWIQSVYVVPEWRRKGVYRAMYQTVKFLAADADVNTVRLYCDSENIAGQSTYTALGMQKSHYQFFEDEIECSEE